MGIRVSYPVEIKMQVIEMRSKGVSVKQVLEELNILNNSQLKTRMKWYRIGELHRLEHLVGKQYTFGKGPEYDSETFKI